MSRASIRDLAVAGALGAACAFGTPIAQAQKSKSTAEAPNPGRHVAAFPGQAKDSVKESKTATGDKVTTHLREFQAGDRYYGTAWTAVPKPPSLAAERAKLLEVAAAEALKTEPGAKLVSRQKVSLNGIPGVAYVIELPQSKLRLRQQVYLVAGVLVEQTFSGPAGSETGRETNRFFDSLKLLP